MILPRSRAGKSAHKLQELRIRPARIGNANGLGFMTVRLPGGFELNGSSDHTVRL